MVRRYVFSDLYYAHEYLSCSKSNLVANSVLGPFVAGNYSPFCGRRGINSCCASFAAVLSAVCKVGVWGAVRFSPRGWRGSTRVSSLGYARNAAGLRVDFG